MRILVINGSPKGKYSVTVQSVRYMQKHFPDVEFDVRHVGQRIKAMVRDRSLFDELIQAVRDSDCVLWCYPVYTSLAPYQLVQFIDLIFERGLENAFLGKYAAQISTSKHFYDHTAYNYIHQISEDLGTKHWPGHCADMDDLTTFQGRDRVLVFARELVHAVENSVPVSTVYLPVKAQIRPYTPSPDLPDVPKTGGYKVVLVTDCADPDSNLGRMIETYRRALPNEVYVLNIGEFDFQGGCLGCFQCAFEGKCVYKDGFDDLHKSVIVQADCVIVAAEVNRHWFNPVWKCYDDRQFYNGHRTSTMGKSIGYMVSGPLRQEANLRQILESRAQVGHLYLLDIVTDEYETDDQITALLAQLAEKTMWALETKPQRPVSFLGVGGMKVFRDLIYVVRGLMQEDHRFYKRHNLYDFPHKQVGSIMQGYLMGFLLKFKKARAKASRAMKESTLKRYDRIMERY